MGTDFSIKDKKIGNNYPTYFIADIAANHDGDLSRAKELIFLSAEAGANAAKFQHFSAETIVSDLGFKSLGKQLSHQSTWKKSVFETYKEASINLEWTKTLKETCDSAGIDFFTSPYSFELVDHVDPFVPAYKIGSGDITWIEIIEYIAKKNKPYILATGASSIEDVKRAVFSALRINTNIAIMQCNTNYTANKENFRYINLKVLESYKKLFPEIVLGLSDHTFGSSTVLGAISLGARIIEKHFTDDNNRDGPDHKFSMNPKTWKEMINQSRELELSLGTGNKKVEDNELDTVRLQRRSIYLNKDINKGDKITRDYLIPLRPSLENSIQPYELTNVLGRKANKFISKGQILKWTDLI